MRTTPRILLWLSMATLAASAQGAELLKSPPPGSVYREYARVLSTGGKEWRVTHPESTYDGTPGPGRFLPNPDVPFTIGRLDGAVRAEAIFDVWGGHVGTSGKRVRFNGHDWLDLPRLATTPTTPECYMQQVMVTVDVPVGHLVEGANVFQGDSAGQICHNFNWGQWGWYSFALRVYLDPEAKVAYPTGRIVSPVTGAVFGENPTIQAEVGPGVQKVEFIGYYENHDTDGDGVYTQWHHNYHRLVSATTAPIQGHIGTATAAPWSVVWNTTEVPTQKWEGIKLVARIKGSDETWYVTEEVVDLSLLRQNSVRLYKASKVPERFWVRVGQTKTCEVLIPSAHNLANATHAYLHLRSWNGVDGAAEPGQAHATQVNGWSLSSYGANHYFGLNRITLPVQILKRTNVFSIHSQSTHHGIETMWPGPGIIVRYNVSNGVCGDGYLDWGEECDDGDGEDDNRCTNDCREQSCGDGQIAAGEQCDDGGTTPGDGCDESCVIEACGNGVAQIGEACDDGDTDDLDGCGNDCTANYCGDNELNNGEQCEDGGTTSGDGCDGNCRIEICGNGFPQVGEACDDGNTNDLDGCGNDCASNFCGDGETNNGEECDDANEDDDDGCRNNCRVPGCGDGRLDPGEVCDDANANDLDGCGNDCQPNFCGDGATNNGEQCDDGNEVNEDLCTNECLLPVVCDNILDNSGFDSSTSGWSFYTSGSGNLSAVGGEARVRIITPGANVQMYQSGVALEASTIYRLRFRGRSSAATDVEVQVQRHVSPFENYGLRRTLDLTTEMREFVMTFTSPPTDRSDGRFMLQMGPFDVADSNYHFDDFLLERIDECPYCGDGLVGLGEQCDDGNAVDEDACANDCRLPCVGLCANVCGDGTVAGDEECDDGNTVGGDGCASDCDAEGCGDGVTGSGEECDDGNTANGDGCSASCAEEYCGDGIVQPGLGEECDGTAAPNWHGATRSYRVPLQAGANGFARQGAVAEIALDLQALLTGAGGAGTVQESSLKLVEVAADGGLVDADVPFQFDGSGAGTLIWIIEGNTATGGTRHFQLYFDTVAFAAPAFDDRVGVTDGVQHAGQSSFRIETDAGTYYFQKEAAGMSGLIDNQGRDWITYSTAAGTAGEYRGIPNLLYPANIYHPGFVSASSALIDDGPLKVTVESPSDNGQFRTRWEFYPGFARMTVLQATGNYWFLYEGTPGGLLDRSAPGNDFLVRSDGTQFSVADSWGAQGTDIPGDEWLYFADPAITRSLFLAHHTNDAVKDWYQPLDIPAGGSASDWMTVFGFGRGANEASLLGGAGRQFTIGLLETTQFPTARDAVNSAYKPLAIAAGAPEQQTFAETCRDDCRISICGDDVIDGTEDCDDGGTVDGDGCDASCRTEVCGNGVVQAGEACDDGDTDDVDACGNDCVANYCGDGEINDGDECDDGGTSGGDGCDENCRTEACGNGVVQAGEACDDGNANDLDACANDCVDNYCGDGVVNNGEACDDGNTDDADLCTNACALPYVCDNLVVNGDFTGGTLPWTFYTNGGAALSTTGGTAQIAISAPGTNVQLYQHRIAVRGGKKYRLRLLGRSTGGADADLLLQKHASPFNAYGLKTTLDMTSDLREHIVVFTTTSGDKTDGRLMLQLGRFDQAGAVYEFDDIRLELVEDCPYCGDGELGLGEQCDDGNDDDGDACGNDCRLPGPSGVCGDGVVGDGEQCDDGDTAGGDGCDAACTIEVCGNGVVQAGEACDDGNTDDLDACGNDCAANVCGDGVVNNGEACDDGNAVDDDGCSNACLPLASVCDSAVRNGDFGAGGDAWAFFTNGNGNFSVDAGAARVQIGAVSGTNVQLYQTSVAVDGSAQYRLSLRARHSAGGNLDIVLQKHASPYTPYGLKATIDLSSEWQDFVILFTTPPGDKTDGRLMLQLGKYDVPGSTFGFDDIRLEKVADCPSAR